MRRSHPVVWVLSFAVPSVLLTAALARAAEEPMITPVGDQFRLEGRGFGHGRGMSQWGAQGAAVQGIGYRQILATYYPGTELLLGDRATTIRVLITADRDGDLRAAPAPGLIAQRGAHRIQLPQRIDGRKVTQWRVRLRSGLLELSGRAGGWRVVPVGVPGLGEPVRLGTGRGVRLVLPKQQRDYRGELQAHRDPSTGELAVVNAVPLEAYLRSVVPSESYSTWRPAALQAQSVAARTYARWRAKNVPVAGGVADICDTTACQVYHGVRRLDRDGRVTKVWEAASTDASIAATAGQYLRYGAAEALTEFSASNGGWSTAGDEPYQVARRDPWDGVVNSAAHSWRATLTVAQLSEQFPNLGRVVGLMVRSRDGNGPWGGRVLLVRVVGEQGSRTLSGPAFARAVRLRHSWWQQIGAAAPTPVETPAPVPPFPSFPGFPPPGPR